MALENPNGEYMITTFDPDRRGGFSMLPDRGVRILHIPTGIQVECASERTAHANKARAMGLIQEKIGLYAKVMDKANGEKSQKGAAWIATVLTVRNMRLCVFDNEGALSFMPYKFDSAMEAAAAAIKAMKQMGEEAHSFTVEVTKKN